MLPGHTEKGQVAAQSGEKPVPTLHWVSHISQLEGPQRSLYYSTERLWESVTASPASVSWLVRLVLETRLWGRSFWSVLQATVLQGGFVALARASGWRSFCFCRWRVNYGSYHLLPLGIHCPYSKELLTSGRLPLPFCVDRTHHTSLSDYHMLKVFFICSSTWGGWKLQNLANTSFFEK